MSALSPMRSIRRRDTWIYLFACGISFSLSGWMLNEQYPINTPEYLILSALFIIGILDTIYFEGTQDIYRLSRMKVIGHWLMRSLMWLLFFWIIYSLIGNNQVDHSASFDLGLFIDGWLILFFLPMLTKLLILTWSSHRLKGNTINYDTILIGSGSKAVHVLKELKDRTPSQGQSFIGSVGDIAIDSLTHLGSIDQLESVIHQYAIDEVIVALDRDQQDSLIQILHSLRSLKSDLMIRITPDSYDFLMGRIKMDAVYGAALIELPEGKMKLWQSSLKRLADILMSVLLLILLSPLIIIIWIKTLRSSSGPVLYRQKRIGRYGSSFTILKFRSMYIDAEIHGPLLSNGSDARCTPWGAFMRKWRLDEIPQFLNVIYGEMSIVGPRPEREFFINQIKKIAPYYSRILTVRPGITSWGQVKYGYASTIDQMIERLKYDLIYIENQSLTLDLKIMLYTVIVLFQGKGK